MPITDYNKKKKLDVDSVSGTPTVGKAQPILLVDGDDSTTGNGDIVIDFANISDAQDIAVYDQNGNLLDYKIENLDTTNNTAVLWCYNSWARDGTTQAQVAYGNNSADTDRQATEATVWDSETDINQRLSMNESSGTILDSTSNNNDSTTENGVTYGASGQFLTSISFDGADDYVQFGDLASGLTSLYTGMWVKYSTKEDLGYLIDWRGSNDSIILRLNGDTDQKFQFFINGTSLNSTTAPQTGTWYHVASFWDGSTARLFVDGTEEDSASISSSGSGKSATEEETMGAPTDKLDSFNAAQNIDQVVQFWNGIGNVDADYIQAEYDASPKAGQVFFSQQAAETTSTAVSATVSDQLNLTETTGSAILFTASDTVAMTENNQQTISDTLSESLGFNEATTSQLQDTLTDQLNLSENTVGILIDTLTDQITFAENVKARLALTVTVTDTLTFGERIDSKLFDTITEQLGLTENVNSTLINAHADQLNLTENVQVAIAEILSDQLQFTEQTSISVAATLADSLDFSENLETQLIDTLTDNLGFSEATAAAIAANLSDQLQFTENLKAFITLQLADQLDFSEETIGKFSKTFTDQLTFSDQVLFATLLEIDAPTKAIITNVNKFAVMENHVFKEGDQADEVSATLEDENGAIDLSNANSVDIVMQDRAGSTVLDTTATIQNAANGEVTYSWSSGDPIDTAGIYRLEWRINDGSGKQETVPNNGYITIEIEEELG